MKREATARHIAGHGAKLVLGARRLERLRALAEELLLGHEAAVPTDVTQYEQVRHLGDHAVQSHGRIDVIINNAGLTPHSPLERLASLTACGWWHPSSDHVRIRAIAAGR